MARPLRRPHSVVRRIVGMETVIIVVVCAALAVPAFAFASRSTTTVVVSPMRRGSATATCPIGEHVSFGGFIDEFKSPPMTNGHAAAFPTSMRRSAPDRWTVTGQSEAIGTGSHLSAVAYCDRGSVSTSASSTVSLPGSRALTAIATCPAGTVVVGGGYSSGSSSTHVEAVGQTEREDQRRTAGRSGRLARVDASEHERGARRAADTCCATLVGRERQRRPVGGGSDSRCTVGNRSDGGWRVHQVQHAYFPLR